MEIKDGMIDVTWLGPEWFGLRLGAGILVVSALLLLFLIKHVFAEQDWYKRLSASPRLQRCLPFITWALLLPFVGYMTYILWLEVQGGVRENGFVWILQGVLVFAAMGLLLAMGRLLLSKPLEGADYPRNWTQGYVGVFRDGLGLSSVGLLLGLASGDWTLVSEAMLAFGIFGIILSIIGESIRCFRRLRALPTP